jgi:hypothetical protein
MGKRRKQVALDCEIDGRCIHICHPLGSKRMAEDTVACRCSSRSKVRTHTKQVETEGVLSSCRPKHRADESPPAYMRQGLVSSDISLYFAVSNARNHERGTKKNGGIALSRPLPHSSSSFVAFQRTSAMGWRHLLKKQRYEVSG